MTTKRTGTVTIRTSAKLADLVTGSTISIKK
jgi:hypothetical protein